MTLLDRGTVSVVVTILAFVGVLALVWLARFPLIAFTFAVFFAEFLEPVVARFQSWLRLSRAKAIAAVYLGIVLRLVVFGLTVGPRIVQQVQLLATTLPNLLENVKSGDVARQLGEQRGWSYDKSGSDSTMACRSSKRCRVLCA